MIRSSCRAYSLLSVLFLGTTVLGTTVLGTTVLGTTLAIATPLPAQAQEASARDRVRRAIERFEAALGTTDPELRRRELEAALAELDEANRLESEVLIEWNLARVEQELGRPVRAIEHVERFLAGVPADHPRRPEAEALLSSLRPRVARLWVETQVTGARVLIEGESRGTTPLSEPIRVPSGEVSVEVSAPGYQTGSRRVRIAGETETHVRIELELEATALGEVRIRCALLDVQITIDDQVRGRTPLEGTAALTPGAHVLIAERPGYRRLRQTIEVELGAESTVDVALEPDPDAELGTLALRIPDADAELTVDGTEVDLDDRGADPRGLHLPAGRHALELDVEEREDWEGVVTIVPGEETVETPELRWEDAVFGRRHDNAEAQRIAGIATLGAGAAALVAGAVLVVHAAAIVGPSAAPVRAQRDACQADFMCRATMLLSLNNQLIDIGFVEEVEYGVSAGLLALGAIASGVGLWLFLDAPSDDDIRRAAHASVRVGPLDVTIRGTF